MTEDPDDEYSKLAKRLLGTTLHKQYRVMELVSRGGQGLLFKGWHDSFDAPVAIKVWAPRAEICEKVDEDWLAGHWQQEGRLGFRAISPHVARVHDYRTENDFEYLVEEWLEGPSLSAVAKQNPQPWRRACELMIQAADGVHALHAVGFLHRDIKPANFILAHDKGRERVVLVDLGLTRHLENHEPYFEHLLEPTGLAMGTLLTMAPEALGEQPGRVVRESVSTDTYGLGVVLYFLLAGRYPFASTDQKRLVTAIIKEPARPLSELGLAVPPALEALLARLLAKNPAERPASPAALKAELQQLLRPPTRGAVAPGVGRGRREPAELADSPSRGERMPSLSAAKPKGSRWHTAMPYAIVSVACAALGAGMLAPRLRTVDPRSVVATAVIPASTSTECSVAPSTEHDPAATTATTATVASPPADAPAHAPDKARKPKRAVVRAPAPAPHTVAFLAPPAPDSEPLMPVAKARPQTLTIGAALVDALRACPDAPRGRVALKFNGTLSSIDYEALDTVGELAPWHGCAKRVLADVRGQGSVTVSL